jgi:DNA-binding MarR family transcriptional regulator
MATDYLMSSHLRMSVRHCAAFMDDSKSFDLILEARRQWSVHWGSAATPSMAAVTSIMRVQQILMRRLNLTLKPFELTFPRYEALMILYLSRRGSMPLGKIGERLQVHPTSVTSLIDGLERTGHIRRVPHERDRRATLAEITDSGRTAAETATAALNGDRFGTSPLNQADLETVVAVLSHLRAEADGFR